MSCSFRITTTNLTNISHCSPRSNIVFLKTHHTGSSTITNILNRYGDRHNLTFVLPNKGHNRLGWPYLFTSASYSQLNGKTPNILCNHARYNREELDRLMPRDTYHVTILRDPADQFAPVFQQFELASILGINSSEPLQDFIDKPWFYLQQSLANKKIEALELHRIQLSRNGMLFDLGLSNEKHENEVNIRAYIKRLEREFDLVMIREYFDESLLLLKNLMCWEIDDMVYFKLNKIDDMVYFKLNKRLTNLTSAGKKLNSVNYRQKIREWNHGDYLLYKHFNRTFWRKVRYYGTSFNDDLRRLREKIADWKHDCTHDSSSSHVTSQCAKMLTNETNYIEYLRMKQNKRD